MTSLPYIVATTERDRNGWPTETGRTRCETRAEAIAVVEQMLSDKYDAGCLFSAQLMQDAQTSQWQLGRWRGPAIGLVVSGTRIYILPQPAWPAQGPEMTWQDFEAAAVERRARAEHKALVKTMVSAVEESSIVVTDPEGFVRGLIERGITLTDVNHALRLGARGGADYLSGCMRSHRLFRA